MTWKDDHRWQILEDCNSISPKLVELCAVAMAFQHIPHVPLNIVTDSAYVADITRLDQALLKETNNTALSDFMKTLWHTNQGRTCPYYVLHI